MEEPTCACANWKIRARTYSDGRTHYVKQCTRCGCSLGAVPKSTPHLFLAGEFDEKLREEWEARYREYLDQRHFERLQKQFEDKSTEWWHAYDRYLLTPEWQAKRDKVLERDKHLCQGCFSRRALTAHHLSYDHFTCEFIFELVSVCPECHERLHAKRSL